MHAPSENTKKIGPHVRRGRPGRKGYSQSPRQRRQLLVVAHGVVHARANLPARACMHTTAQPPWNVAPPASAPRPILSQSRCLDVSAWLQFAGRGVLCGRDKRAGLIWTQPNRIRCPVCVRACIAGKWTRSWFQLCANGQPPEQHYLDGSCMVDGLSRSRDRSIQRAVPPFVFPRAPLGSLAPRESCPSSQPLRARLIP